ncbi:MAG: hypothetical protein HY791_38335 [Deltaproteobacteria bacterium]|nr:hypothetical protein [Deltaproteobacteria bacterium]
MTAPGSSPPKRVGRDTTTSARVTEIFSRTAVEQPNEEIRAAMERIREHPDDAECAAELARLWLARGSPEVALSWSYRAAHLSKGASLHRELIERVSAAIESADEEDSGQISWRETSVSGDEHQDTELGLGAALLGGAGLPTSSALDRIDSTAQIERTRARAVDAMEALLGASLFPHLAPRTSIYVEGTPKRRRSFRAVVIAAVVIAAAVGSAYVVSKGLDRRAHTEAAAKIGELDQLLQVGAYHLAAPLIEEVRAVGVAHLGEVGALVDRADALVFRRHDADPARLARVGTSTIPDPITAAATRPRADQLDLVGYRAVDAKTDRPKGDADARFLIASMLARAGEAGAASAAFAKMESAEPTHLPHLYEWAKHEARRHRTFELANVVEAMNDSDPKSPWTRMAAALAEPEDALPVLEEIATSSAVAPVPRAWANIARAAALDADEQVDAANAALDAALELSNRQPIFAMDFAESLLEDGRDRLALRLVSAKDWPDDLVARSVKARIESTTGAEGSLEKLREALMARPSDPRLALDYVEAYSDTEVGPEAKKPSTYYAEIRAKWPELEHVLVDHASALANEGDSSGAERLLARREAITEVEARRAADLLYARILLHKGSRGPASKLVEALLEEMPDDEDAKELLETIESSKPPPKVVKRKSKKAKRAKKKGGRS